MPVLGHRNVLYAARFGRAVVCHPLAFFALAAIAASDLNATETKVKLTREYDLKAAFLFNFVQFVDWPTGAFASNNAPIVIGVLGDDPFGATLDRMVQGETIKNRRLVIKRSRRVEDLKTCQVVFISKSEKARVARILGTLDDASVFTVGEMEGFARRGGVTNFFTQGNKVRFEINAEAARRKGLKISAQLLDLGVEVDSPTAQKNK